MSLATIQISPARLTTVPARIVLIAAAAFVVLVPSLHLLPYLGTYDGQRILEILLLIGFTGAVLFHKGTRLQIVRLLSEIPRLTGALCFALLILGSASAVLAERPIYAFLELGHLVLLGLVTCILAVEYRRDEQNFIRVVVAAVLMTVALYSFRVATSFVGHLGYGFPLWPDANSGFIHPRYFNQLQTWTLPFVALAVIRFSGRGRVVTSVTMAAAAIWWCLLFASGGRGTLLASLVGLGAVACLFGRRSMELVKTSLKAAAFGFVAFVILFRWIGDGAGSLLERGTEDSGRIELWRAAVDMIEAHPIFGVGPMHYAYADGLEAAHPHNFLLQLGAEFGVPVLIVSLVLGGILASQFFKRRHALVVGAGYGRIAIVSAACAGLAQALVDGMFVTPVSQMMAVVVGGMLWGMMRSHATRSIVPRRVLVRFVPALTVLALGATLTGVSRDVTVLNQRERAVLELKMEKARQGGLKYAVMTPRFWQQGWIGTGSDFRAASLVRQ